MNVIAEERVVAVHDPRTQDNMRSVHKDVNGHKEVSSMPKTLVSPAAPELHGINLIVAHVLATIRILMTMLAVLLVILTVDKIYPELMPWLGKLGLR